MLYILLTYLFSPIIYILLLFKKKAIERILIIQTAKIGDLICSTPVFRAVKEKYPKTYLSVMVNPVARGIIEHNPYVDKVITLESGFYRGLIGKIRLAGLIYKGRYDIGISLNPNVPYTLAMFWGLIPLRLSLMPDFVGITYKAASIFTNYLEQHSRGRLVAETYMKTLKAININNKDISKDVFKSSDADDKVERLMKGRISNNPPSRPLSKREDGQFIGLAVTSGNRLKEWGTENMAALADKLINERNAIVILIGSEKDKDVSDSIVKISACKEKIVDAVGKFTLAELPALIERLSLFIGVDTGILYMADALNVPLIDIAGPSDMEDQRPTGVNIIIIQKKLDCIPCSHAFKAPYSCSHLNRECITNVTVKEVFESASLILNKL